MLKLTGEEIGRFLSKLEEKDTYTRSHSERVAVLMARFAAAIPLPPGQCEQMRQAGVELLACKACSDSYGVSEGLEKLGIKVTYMGEPFTQMLKDEYKKVITL